MPFKECVKCGNRMHAEFEVCQRCGTSNPAVSFDFFKLTPRLPAPSPASAAQARGLTGPAESKE